MLQRVNHEVIFFRKKINRFFEKKKGDNITLFLIKREKSKLINKKRKELRGI